MGGGVTDEGTWPIAAGVFDPSLSFLGRLRRPSLTRTKKAPEPPSESARGGGARCP